MNVYRFGDDPSEYMYIAAQNSDAAIDEYRVLFSMSGPFCGYVHELTEAELDTVMVSIMDEDGSFAGMEQTVRESLRESLDVEDTAPFFLCGAE
jgi:hypothetical protein